MTIYLSNIIRKKSTTEIRKIQDFDDFMMFMYLGSFIFGKFLGNTIYRIVGVIFMAYFLLKIIMRRCITINVGLLWQFGFISCVVGSLAYADTIKIENLYTILTQTGFILSISQYFFRCKRNVESIEKVLKYIVFWGACFMLYILFTQFNSFQYGRLGSRALSEQFDNAIGFSYYSIIITVVLIWHVFHQKRHNVFNWSLVMLSLFISMMTGGRKAILLPLLFLIVYVFLLYRKDMKKLVLWSFLVTLLILAIVELSLNVPSLYQIFGYRLEGLMYTIFGRGVGDVITSGSDELRFSLISNGLKLFFEKPILGYGLAMSSELNYASGIKYLHSHNNFVEMLISGGIVMFVSYYWIYAYIFKRMGKRYKSDKSGLSQFFLAFLVMNLFSDLGTTSYNLLHFNIFILISVIYLKVLEEGKINGSKTISIKDNDRIDGE